MTMDTTFWDELIAGLDASDLDWLITRIRRRKASLHPEKIARKTIIKKI
jgi:hypothetical protein